MLHEGKKCCENCGRSFTHDDGGVHCRFYHQEVDEEFCCDRYASYGMQAPAISDNKIVQFIKIFQSPTNLQLFTDCACYWFSVILYERFCQDYASSECYIVYNPNTQHFATFIDGDLYDITGKLSEDDDFEEWEEYRCLDPVDADLVAENCIYFNH